MVDTALADYSLPGVLHFLQAEWRRFERERNDWIIERAELKARIALLEGERRGVENSKLTLLKRVKMLEYALREERKRHTGKSGKDKQGKSEIVDQQTTNQVIPTTKDEDNDKNDSIHTHTDNSKQRQKSRDILKSCLQEINYLTSLPTKLPLTGTFLSSLNLPPTQSNQTGHSTQQPQKYKLNPDLSIELSSSPSSASNQQQPQRSSNGKTDGISATQQQHQDRTTNLASASNPIASPRKSSLSYKQQQQQLLEPSSIPIASPVEQLDMEVPINVDEVAMINNIEQERKQFDSASSLSSSSANATTPNSSKDQQQPQDNEAALSEQLQEKFHLSEDKVAKLLKHATKNEKKQRQKQRQRQQQQEDRLLAGDFDPDQVKHIVDSQHDAFTTQPKVWKSRITIKGHLDSVRSVCFHPERMIAASGSDDGTVKIWNLQRAAARKGSSLLEEADPSITFRGHTNIVTGVIMTELQEKIYSASLDSTIRVWALPSEEKGPFPPVDPMLNLATLIGHTDAIWDFKVSEPANILASASADGTVRLWDISDRMDNNGNVLKSTWTMNGLVTAENPLLYTAADRVSPTSLDFYRNSNGNASKLAVSFANAKILLYDIETGKVICTLKGSDEFYNNSITTQINRILSHPTSSLIVSAHEDGHIKFFDINSGQCIETVSGHLDGVTCLDIHSSGATMVSGGHDSSIRLWDMSSKTCIQEFSAHRRKGDEGVLAAKFHPTYPWLISGGADGIVKIYHHGH